MIPMNFSGVCPRGVESACSIIFQIVFAFMIDEKLAPAWLEESIGSIKINGTMNRPEIQS